MTDPRPAPYPADTRVKPGTKRKAISTRTRFEVFKRDRFTCQYCGAHPPGVLLHVDHILAVANGGSNDASNLATACAKCNLGKGAVPLGAALPGLKDKTAEVKEAERQLKGYRAAMDDRRARLDRDVDSVERVFATFFPERQFTDKFRISVRVFIEKIGAPDVLDAMERACCKLPSTDRALQYFCGICWGKVREQAA
jgi:hypothetical protein